MDRSYWEKIAPDYNEEIFDVLHQDKKGIIKNTIRKLGHPSRTVMDAGCAIGKWLPVLSPVFGKVIAADISAKNLAIAQKNHSALSNVEYIRADFSSEKSKLPKANVTVCINAILTHSMKKRDAFFNNLARFTMKDGQLVLVVPSMESYLFTRIIQNKWKIDQALFREKLSQSEGLEKYRNVQEGNLDIDQVPTKHYIKEELVLLLDRDGFSVDTIKKIEYDWKTEFVAPPRWLKEPRPWDWMCVATRQ